VLIFGLFGLVAVAQEDSGASKPDPANSEPVYSDTFSGSIIELRYTGDTPKKVHPDDVITAVIVSRSVLGKPAEKRAFVIKSDTRTEGSLRVRARVTIGYVVADELNVARLIVVRAAQKAPEKK